MSSAEANDSEVYSNQINDSASDLKKSVASAIIKKSDGIIVKISESKVGTESVLKEISTFNFQE